MSDQDRTENGRKLAASLRRAAEMAERGEIQEVGMDLPIQPKPESRGFADGAAAERYLRENVCPNGNSPYGPYIPPSRLGISLEEKAEVVWFLPHHIALFKRITPPVALALGDHAVQLAERRTVSRWWRWAWKIGLAVVVAAFSVARWGVDQIGLIRDIANLIRGHGQ